MRDTDKHSMPDAEISTKEIVCTDPCHALTERLAEAFRRHLLYGGEHFYGDVDLLKEYDNARKDSK